MRIPTGLENLLLAAAVASPVSVSAALDLVSLLLTLSTIKSRLGSDGMTNWEFLIKVLFIFVVSIVKKELNQPCNYSSLSCTRFKGKKGCSSTKVHLSDINQLLLNFSTADLFISSHLVFNTVAVMSIFHYFIEVKCYVVACRSAWKSAGKASRKSSTTTWWVRSTVCPPYAPHTVDWDGPAAVISSHLWKCWH